LVSDMVGLGLPNLNSLTIYRLRRKE